MENIFSYLNWRGDLDFTSASFNNIDNLIFCALSYLKFDTCLRKDEVITIKELYERCRDKIESKSFVHKNSEKLFSLLSESNRYKNVSIARYERVNDSSLEKQFGALTFILPTNVLVVVYSGTDETVVGWKEDFNLSFLDVIPAQEAAKIYLEDILNHSKKDVIVCGHSKGGNLAMYASIFCEDSLKKRILHVYNNDGPGLSEKVFLLDKFALIKNKITTFIPKFSVIGSLFTNDSKVKIIESYQIGILEHDLFSWKVNGTNFIFCEELNKKAKNIVEEINSRLNNIPKESKRKIINIIYDLLLVFKIENLDDLFLQITDFPSVLKKYNLGIENIDNILKILELIFQITKHL